ncbi:uncharacterized protein LOC132915364 [Bombus pascuorum]|uniref:uncharacterized protein LOC132915361 n=1 Tax=Bombus pascuorum TaxID=65598 RepID=UPI00298E364C|nr:uncharacterized protein LOC132915361 [Bombus pascuorum]XP_060831150.1 uncharacterized protein LOC132915364 [Bombus pascuorum]
MAIKVTQLHLPTFDGAMESWNIFYDIFSVEMERTDYLTPVQKLQYLRSTVMGKSAYCIRSLNTADANYTHAIAILKEKFDCPEPNLDLRHWNAIQNYPKLTKESSKTLEYLVDTIKQYLRALTNLGAPTRQTLFLWTSSFPS